MTLVAKRDFSKWAATKEIAVTPRRPPGYAPDRNFERFWNQPEHPAGMVNLIRTILDKLPHWDACYLWPRSGSWTLTTGTDENLVISAIYRGARIPKNGRGALRFTRRELSSIISILFAQAAFGGSVSDDVSFIPDHGGAIAAIDHHDMVWVSFAHEPDPTSFFSVCGRPITNFPPGSVHH